MCGIAGFNIGQDVADGFGVSRAENIAHDSLLYNRHRGIHAGGWYVQYDTPQGEDGKQSRLFKQPGDPKNITVFPQGKPVTMAVHTRAATGGSPENVDNDHPLVVEDAVIVHNGMISNDKQLKMQLAAQMDGDYKFPTVDSCVLAGGLNLAVKDWYDEDNLSKFAGFLQHQVLGSVAMAGSLGSRPGVQVLARTHGSPLVVARHKLLPVVLWASEADAVFKMMGRFNLSYGDFWVAPLDADSLLIADHGVIVNSMSWGHKSGWGSHSSGKWESWRRLSPYMDDVTVRDLTSTSYSPGWPCKDDFPTSIFMHDTEKHFPYRSLTAARMFEEKNRFDVDVLQLAAEATQIYFMAPQAMLAKGFRASTNRFYLLFGEKCPLTEIVVTGLGTVLDVCYHKDPDSLLFPRWQEKPAKKKEEEKVSDDPLAKMFGAAIDYKEPRELFDADDATNRRIRPYGERRIQNQLGMHNATVSSLYRGDEPRKCMIATVGCAITVDKHCTEHDKWLTAHTRLEALACSVFREEAMLTAANADSLFDLSATYLLDVKLSYYSADEAHKDVCKLTTHSWQPWIGQRVTGDTYMLVEEECSRCFARRTISDDFIWLDEDEFVLLDPVSGEIDGSMTYSEMLGLAARPNPMLEGV